MIINVKNGKDVITLDFQLNQIRYCKDIAGHGPIEFIDQSKTIMDCYEYLRENNPPSFLSSLAEDMENETGIGIDPNNLKVISDQDYIHLFFREVSK
jgi:hypothetical protein